MLGKNLSTHPPNTFHTVDLVRKFTYASNAICYVIFTNNYLFYWSHITNHLPHFFPNIFMATKQSRATHTHRIHFITIISTLHVVHPHIFPRPGHFLSSTHCFFNISNPLAYFFKHSSYFPSKYIDFTNFVQIWYNKIIFIIK